MNIVLSVIAWVVVSNVISGWLTQDLMGEEKSKQKATLWAFVFIFFPLSVLFALGFLLAKAVNFLGSVTFGREEKPVTPDQFIP